VRSAILIFLAILAFATTPARAQGTWLETRMIKGICSNEATPVANTDRLARRLNLTDPQKAALTIFRCTKNAFPATYLQKITTTFSSITRLRPELKPAPPVS
jgi:hypothetical protein